MMYFLHTDPRNNTFHDEEDILMHADMAREVKVLSNAIIVAVPMQTMNKTFLNRSRMAVIDYNSWTERK